MTRVEERTEAAQPVQAVPTDLYGLVDFMRTRTADQLDDDFAKLVLALGADQADGLWREAVNILSTDRRVANLRSVVAERIGDATLAVAEAEEALRLLLIGPLAAPDYAEGDNGSDLAFQLRVAVRALRMAGMVHTVLDPDAATALLPVTPVELAPEACALPADWEGEHDHAECLSTLADLASEQAQQVHPDRVGLCGAESSSKPHAWVPDLQAPGPDGYLEYEVCGQLREHPIHDQRTEPAAGGVA